MHQPLPYPPYSHHWRGHCRRCQTVTRTVDQDFGQYHFGSGSFSQSLAWVSLNWFYFIFKVKLTDWIDFLTVDESFLLWFFCKMMMYSALWIMVQITSIKAKATYFYYIYLHKISHQYWVLAMKMLKLALHFIVVTCPICRWGLGEGWILYEVEEK